MKTIQLLLKVLFICLAFASCNTNDDVISQGPNDDSFAENFGGAVNRDFIGQVIDTNNQPIQGVNVSIGSTTVQTDVNGVFIINEANVNQKFAYIQAKKVGFVDGSRAMVPTSGSNNVKIMLLPSTPIATISAGQVSEVVLPSGTKVTFDGAFQDENGTTYTGDVQVAMYHLLPSNENIDKLMPGMLYAQRANNEPAVLETYGMLNVELKGTGGQKLNIKSGHTAEISQLIDDAQLSSAPSTIPLWHFDEAKGYWKEDGVATKVGNKYVGEVSHFSWWNCDTFSSVVTLTITVVDANGNPISNAGVSLIVNSTNFTSYIQSTNTDGQVSGLIPANQVLTLSLYGALNCGISYATTIGPFSSNTDLPVITLNSSTTLTTEVVGNLLKCDGNNVTNGYVFLSRNGNSSVTPVINGAFSFNELYCNTYTDFTLKGIDFDNFETTGSISYNYTPSTTIIGDIQACTNVTEFISYQIDNQPLIFISNNIYYNGPFAGIWSTGFGTQTTPNINNISIRGSATTPGTYDTSTFTIGGPSVFIDATIPNTMQFQLNQFGVVGAYIDMTFNGTYENSTGSHSLTGTIHVIRDE